MSKKQFIGALRWAFIRVIYVAIGIFTGVHVDPEV